MISLDIGSRIKEARLAANMTQDELARKIGVSKNAISNYEHGVSTPKVELLCGIMKHLNVDANYLYGYTKNPAPMMLAPRERQIILEYRKMSAPEKKRFDMMLGLEPEELPQPKQA